MVDMKKLERKLEAIDKNYELSRIDEDTLFAIALLAEKKTQLKNLSKKHIIGHRYNIIVGIIKSEFPKCDINQLTWLLFKNGYIKKTTLFKILVISFIFILITAFIILINLFGGFGFVLGIILFFVMFFTAGYIYDDVLDM